MKYFKTLFILIMSSILFLGCAPKTPNVAFNAGLNKDIKKIDIVAPKNLENLTIYYHNHPGMNFGIIGGIAAVAEFSSKESSYNKLIVKEDFNASSYFLAKVESELKKYGYEVNILQTKTERDNEFVKEYPKSECDAYLDSIIGSVGYFAGSPTSAYKATVKVAVRLVKAKDKSIIYDKHVAVGENFALSEDVDYLDADKDYFYESFSDLETNAIKSLEGIKKALDKIATHIALSLKK